MFHERGAVVAPKLNMSWTSVGVMEDDGTSMYTTTIKIRLSSDLYNKTVLSLLFFS
jgi:hypothetical protein